MISHVAMFRWKDQPERHSARLAEALPEMMARIGGIEFFKYGADLGRVPDGYHFVLLVHLADEVALGVYEKHKAHQEVIQEQVNPALDRLAIGQFEI